MLSSHRRVPQALAAAARVAPELREQEAARREAARRAAEREVEAERARRAAAQWTALEATPRRSVLAGRAAGSKLFTSLFGELPCNQQCLASATRFLIQ